MASLGEGRRRQRDLPSIGSLCGSARLIHSDFQSSTDGFVAATALLPAGHLCQAGCSMHARLHTFQDLSQLTFTDAKQPSLW